MYNILMYKKAILHAGMKKSYIFANCSITETIQATVCSFKTVIKRLESLWSRSMHSF